jgi:hypothetical protein
MPSAHSETSRKLLSSLRRLSDGELVAKVKKLAAQERRSTALLVAHLAEMDTRDIHLREGYSSLFAYCREVLALSEHEALNRIEVARAARKFPVVLDLLEAGTVNLTAVRLLAPHLTPENHRAVLESAHGKRTVEVREIVARLSPQPDVPTSIRKCPATKPATGASKNAPSASSPPAACPPAGLLVSTPTLAPTPAPGPCPQSPPELAPLSKDRYHLKLTISGDTVEKLRLAKDMLRHAVPSGDDAEILDRALTTLLTDLARKKFAATEKPRSSRKPSNGSRHIPAEVRRAVWVRDLGRCAFVGKTGRRCNERAFVEFHHVKPWAVGGEATAGNIELRCKRHNDHEARVFFDRGPERGVANVVRESATPYGAGAGTRFKTSSRPRSTGQQASESRKRPDRSIRPPSTRVQGLSADD